MNHDRLQHRLPRASWATQPCDLATIGHLWPNWDVLTSMSARTRREAPCWRGCDERKSERVPVSEQLFPRDTLSRMTWTRRYLSDILSLSRIFTYRYPVYVVSSLSVIALYAFVAEADASARTRNIVWNTKAFSFDLTQVQSRFLKNDIKNENIVWRRPKESMKEEKRERELNKRGEGKRGEERANSWYCCWCAVIVKITPRQNRKLRNVNNGKGTSEEYQ